ncbi:MAG: citrate lyase acyl carrier protein, partial [Spirochaetaceae bacterium]|nr:citrate lyase acyl carrier protein [Spirochaetaceae bacterium]
MASEMEYCASDAGLHAKSDCVASYIPGPGPLEIAVKSSVESLFGAAIKAAALRIALDFGVKSGCIEVDDDGALGETVAARIEAALWKAGFSCRKRKESAIPVPLVRGPSLRQRSRRTRL